MPHPTANLLRQRLREQFPAAHRNLPVPEPSSQSLTAPSYQNELPQGGITEVTPAGPACGPNLFIASLISREPDPTPMPGLALIDGRCQFDPCSFTPQDCSKLLWIRCSNGSESLKVTDLILRDGNLPRVILDLLGFKPRELAEIPTSTWHRFKQWIEANNLILIVLTPCPMIPCAILRLSLHSRFSLSHFDHPREQLMKKLEVSPVLQRKYRA